MQKKKSGMKLSSTCKNWKIEKAMSWLTNLGSPRGNNTKTKDFDNFPLANLPEPALALVMHHLPLKGFFILLFVISFSNRISFKD